MTRTFENKLSRARVCSRRRSDVRSVTDDKPILRCSRRPVRCRLLLRSVVRVRLSYLSSVHTARLSGKPHGRLDTAVPRAITKPSAQTLSPGTSLPPPPPQQIFPLLPRDTSCERPGARMTSWGYSRARHYIAVTRARAIRLRIPVVFLHPSPHAPCNGSVRKTRARPRTRPCRCRGTASCFRASGRQFFFLNLQICTFDT